MIYLSDHIEHTALKQGMTEINIRDNLELCYEYSIPVIVIPPSFVKYTASVVRQGISVCTVIGFPLGYNTTETKVCEIRNAIDNGAQEIDLVIDNSLIKGNAWTELDERLGLYRKACEGKILKIIVETSLLTRQELDNTADSLAKNGVDFIKTSTGFVGEGAKTEDIKFLKDYYGHALKIKASGGIKTKAQVIELLEAGADRIGTSSTKQVMEN